MSAFPTPSIWTPRNGPWWRLPTWFTAGKTQRNPATGKGKRYGNEYAPGYGKVPRHTGTRKSCCCQCEACSGIGQPPKYITAVFEGTTSCKDCRSTFGDGYFKVLSDSFDGVYDLLPVPSGLVNQCRYEAAIPTFEIQHYLSFGCVNPDKIITPTTVYAVMSFNPGPDTGAILSAVRGGIAPFVNTQFNTTGTQSVRDLCTVEWAWSYASYNCVSPVSLFYGGTMTLIPNF